MKRIIEKYQNLDDSSEYLSKDSTSQHNTTQLHVVPVHWCWLYALDNISICYQNHNKPIPPSKGCKWLNPPLAKTASKRRQSGSNLPTVSNCIWRSTASISTSLSPRFDVPFSRCAEEQSSRSFDIMPLLIDILLGKITLLWHKKNSHVTMICPLAEFSTLNFWLKWKGIQ